MRDIEMGAIYWTVIGFLLGAIPFSLWLGKLSLNADIRRYGDGNPGATNAWRAGGWHVGLPSLLLDYLKGAVPVGLANFWVGISGWGLVAVALAPALGHAYSPFLRFRGGKALAVTFGLWTGLTLAEGPTVFGLLLALFFIVQQNDGWAVVFGLLTFLGYLVVRQAGLSTLVIWGANTFLLTWKYRSDLREWPQPRPWLLQLMRRTIE